MHELDFYYPTPTINMAQVITRFKRYFEKNEQIFSFTSVIQENYVWKSGHYRTLLTPRNPKVLNTQPQ